MPPIFAPRKNMRVLVCVLNNESLITCWSPKLVEHRAKLERANTLPSYDVFHAM